MYYYAVNVASYFIGLHYVLRFCDFFISHRGSLVRVSWIHAQLETCTSK